MKLNMKKRLAAKVLRIGIGRVKFEPSRLDDIKEAITRQDIKDLIGDKAIKIKPEIGRHKKEKRKRKRGVGKVKKKVIRRKRDYILRIRMLRRELAKLKKQNKISGEEFKKLREMCKMGRILDRKSLYGSIKQD